jgi:glycosyltransferase involved in cell wall biosynthesis
MRILQISSASSFGGGERHFVDLCLGLTEADDNVIAAVRPDTGWSSRLDFMAAANIKTVALRNSADIFSASRIAGIIRDRKIDIVHAHLARDYPLASLAVRKSRNAKLILTRHVMFPMKNIHRYLLTNVDAVIAVSDAVKKNLANTFPADKIVCVPNGVAAQPMVDRTEAGNEFRFENNISFDDRVVTNIGELVPLKGQHEFVLAAAEVLKKRPEAFFVIVGKDRSFDQSYRRDLKRLAKILGINERILFLDWIDDLSTAFAATDVFVSSSRSESFGLSILEAMAAQIAVVATATDGAKELIKSHANGILVPINEPVELADAVIGLLADNESAQTIAAEARRTALENFSLEKMIVSTRKVYSEVLNR